MRIQEIQRSYADPADDWESTGQLDTVPNMKMVPGSDRYGYVLRQFAGQELLNFTGSDLAINFYDTKPEGSDKVLYIGYLQFRNFNAFGFKNGVQVSNVMLDRRYRGKDIGVMMYTTALQLGYTIVADDSQTAPARKLWIKLNQTPGVTVRGLTLIMRGEIDPTVASEFTNQNKILANQKKLKRLGATPLTPVDSVSQFGEIPFVFPVSPGKEGSELVGKNLKIYSSQHPEDTEKYVILYAQWTGSLQSVTEEVDNKPTIGINVRSDGNIDYASLIVDGKKKYESRKTDSLRPYVGRTVGIVRTGNGPAVAIGQVTIGEPIVVDAEKFDKLRKQHLVPQGSLFDIGVNDTKYLYPMINPIRWDNEKLIKNKGIVARKIEEQELTEFDYNKHVKMLNAYMQKLGYSYIGHGTDAHVFAKEEGPVIKVLIPENGDISTAKNPFLAFLNYCEKNANNPHLPKFIETTKQPIQLGAEKFDQVVMERLEELDPDYDEMIIDMMYSIDEGRPLDPQYRQYANFYKTLKSVIATGTKLGFSNDIIAHDYSNVMQRGDTLVIADPWVSAGLKEELSEGLIDFVQRKLGLKWGQAGDVIKGSVVAEYLDSQGDTIDSDKYINSKFKLMNISDDEAAKYREISDRSGWPSTTPYEKIKDWGIDDYKMNRIRRNDVTYQSLMKHIPVVSKRGFIINGNHRIARAIELGIDPIPVLKEI